jgi:hypothetical protein
MRSVPRLYNEEQLQLQGSLEIAVRKVGGWCAMADSMGVSEAEWWWSEVSWLLSDFVILEFRRESADRELQ